MIVERGVPEDSHANGGGSLNEGVLAITGVGKSAGNQGAGVPEDKECSDDDDDEDDILPPSSPPPVS